MSDVVLADPTLDRSNDDEEHARYLREMHKIIIILNGGILGFLQLEYQSANTSLFKTHHPTILSFMVFFLIYVVLRVSEIKLRVPELRKLVGNVGHFFGALAALLLLSIISSVLALFLLPLTLLWFSAVMYISFKELDFSPENDADADPPNRPPV